MQNNLFFALKMLGIVWFVHIINLLVDYRLNAFGIIPRTFRGLRGIILSPFLHGNFNHLFFNSVPLFVLIDLILMQGQTAFFFVTICIIISSGLLIWLFGKNGIHIGASSVIMGYFGFLLAESYFEFNAKAIIVAGVCIYYFGGLFIALLPSVKKNVSWEGHVFGFIAGVGTAFLAPYLLNLLIWLK
ncbi:MAG: rhomboid family intramembrane serine protease [Gammaproteobacteria bacterium]|nr:rhomboid family intramembrane serine protease [Gammaproteobacteria bacterium]